MVEIEVRDRLRAAAAGLQPSLPPSVEGYVLRRRRRRRRMVVLAVVGCSVALVPVQMLIDGGSQPDRATDESITTAPESVASPSHEPQCGETGQIAQRVPDYFEKPSWSFPSASDLASAYLRDGETTEQVDAGDGRAQYVLVRADGSTRATLSLIYRPDLGTWVEEGARWCPGESLAILG